MKALLGPFVLRRLKAEVAQQLAPKQQRLELVALTPVQAALYAGAVASLRKSANAAGALLLWAVPTRRPASFSRCKVKTVHACVLSLEAKLPSIE